jgi:hypothetical protein
MPASEAQILANQANSRKSTGPTSTLGKQASRSNSYKHGLTATVVLPEGEAAEIERRFVAFREELQPSGEVGKALARHAATMSVRMERCAEHENAALTERVRQAEDDFLAPEGVDEATAAKLRAEAGKRALFDSSPEAILARKYEAAAQRGFFKALKELRLIEKAAKVSDAEIEEQVYRETLASFSRMTNPGAGSTAPEPVVAPPTPRNRFEPVTLDELAAFRGQVDVPFSIGKPR